MRSLNRLRPSDSTSANSTGAELDVIIGVLEANTESTDGAWLELFQGTYLRRTIIASLLFWVCICANTPLFATSGYPKSRRKY